MQDKSRKAAFVGMVTLVAVSAALGGSIITSTADAAPVQEGQVTRIVGSGKVATENRPVSGFQALSVGGAGVLTITQGDTESLTVEADDNLLPYIVTEVKDGRLHIGFKDHTSVSTKTTFRYRLTVKNLNRINISGAIESEMASLRTDRLDLGISGAAKFDLKAFEAKELKLDVSGAGRIHIAGSVDSQKLSFSGAGRYEAAELTSRTATVDASGACHLLLNVSEGLVVGASGASTIEYVGNPNITKHTSGVSTIRPHAK